MRLVQPSTPSPVRVPQATTARVLRLAAAILGVLVLVVTFAPPSRSASLTGSYPAVSDTPTGLVIRNTGDDALTSLRVTVDAQVPRQQAKRAFSRTLARIGASSQAVVPYRSLKSSAGQFLNPAQFAPSEYHVAYHSRGGTGSLSASISSSTGAGSNAVSEAILKGDMTTLRRLLDQDPALVNARNAVGSTPLFDAAFFGNTEAVKILLERHADVNVKNDFGETPLDKARSGHSAAVEQLLISHGAKSGK